MNRQPRTDGEAAAYEAGLRAGYDHGYDVGRAHVDHDRVDPIPEPVDLPPARLERGPDRDELIARGYIPRDLTRPPSLPAGLWDATDWAKAETRDLPATDHGRAQWRAALDAGRVPPDLAQEFTARERAAAELTDTITAGVTDSGRAVADAQHRVDANQPDPDERDRERRAEHARRRGADLAVDTRGLDAEADAR